MVGSVPENVAAHDEVLLVHGTPESDLTYFLESVDNGGLRPATIEEVTFRAQGITRQLILCGHTHIPRSARLESDCLIVNPGSVGLPAYEDNFPFPHKVQTGSPHARYAIVEKQANRWTAEFFAVTYDWEKAASIAELRGRPDWARALRTGLI